jgi:antitoxin component of MazEF toxin-antitoxin module
MNRLGTHAHTHQSERSVRTRISKWGNELGIRIPSEIAEAAQLQDGAEVDVALRDRELVITPVHSLGDAITPENLPELPDDLPCGAEIW